MRDSLKQSLERNPGWDGYPKGSVVLCISCGKPIFRLEGRLEPGIKLSRAVRLIKPVTAQDLADLIDRQDIDPGIGAAIRGWTPEERTAHLERIVAPTMGQPVVCPVCLEPYCAGRTAESGEFTDRGFVLELVTVPPRGMGELAKVRGAWLH